MRGADRMVQTRGMRLMPPVYAALTWGDGIAALLTLGIITFLLFV
jgi:hypothetical protein